MNEASLQTWVVTAMKWECAMHNITMRARLPPSNDQSPVDANGKPYDVGVLLKDAYLVGIEFKVLLEGSFPSWSERQHQAYLALTDGPHLKLPLFYAYNDNQLETLDDLYNESQFQCLLTQAKLSLPKELPAKTPNSATHQTVYDWLLTFFQCPGRPTKDGWLPLFVGDNHILQTASDAFSGVVWLLVSAHTGLTFTWALTHREMLQHVAKLKATWDNSGLGELSKDEVRAAFENAALLIAEYANELRADAQSQHDSAAEMDDNPRSRSPGMRF